jgi:hypothetical protein
MGALALPTPVLGKRIQRNLPIGDGKFLLILNNINTDCDKLCYLSIYTMYSRGFAVIK